MASYRLELQVQVSRRSLSLPQPRACGPCPGPLRVGIRRPPQTVTQIRFPTHQAVYDYSSRQIPSHRSWVSHPERGRTSRRQSPGRRSCSTRDQRTACMVRVCRPGSGGCQIRGDGPVRGSRTDNRTGDAAAERTCDGVDASLTVTDAADPRRIGLPPDVRWRPSSRARDVDDAGDWSTVSPTGQSFKRHLSAFRKRYEGRGMSR